MHNIRVYNNCGVNASHGGSSSQPIFGGPAYFIRDILSHVPSGVAFKFSAKGRRTIRLPHYDIGEQVARDPSSNMHYRNSLFLGRDTPDRAVMTWGECD